MVNATGRREFVKMDLALMHCCDLDQSVECACLVSFGGEKKRGSDGSKNWNALALNAITVL